MKPDPGPALPFSPPRPSRPRPHRVPRWTLCAPALVFFLGCAGFDPAILDDVLGPAEAGAPLDEATVARGLRQALAIGTERAVATVGREDGYWADELIRIRLPEELEDMATTLRRIGFSRQVDELELAMNRAAEDAAKEAVGVFKGVISSMTIADAFGILRGSDSAATDYLRGRSETELTRRFQPVIEDHMAQVGLSRAYGRLAETYNALPFVTRPAVDLEDYLTERALDGLFHELAKEEKKIRDNPIARTTELLRKVFGAR